MVINNPETIRLKNTKSEIGRLSSEFGKFAKFHHIPKKVVFDIQLALDEILTNTVNYGYADENEHEIDVRFLRNKNLIEIEVIDDAVPFNILEVEDPETEQSVEEKPIGGLGIYLVKELMDDLEYHRRKGKNKLVIRKKVQD